MDAGKLEEMYVLDMLVKCYSGRMLFNFRIWVQGLTICTAE